MPKLLFGLSAAILRGMTIKVGTIQEMTGNGYELLVDSETRSYVLAKFMDGKLVGTLNGDSDVHSTSFTNGLALEFEKTLIA
jgi:hypothetical protein